MRLLHLDSTGLHNTAKDQEYAIQLWMVWHLLYSNPLQLVPMIKDVPVFHQRSNYECGFFMLRFIELYIHFIYGNDPHLDKDMASDIFLVEVLTAEAPASMQKNVIQTVANELGNTSVTTLYKPPFC